jgi:dienelactone hydrolase
LEVDLRIRKLAGNAPLAMRFVGGTAAEAREWQGAFKTQLEALLGAFRPPASGNSILERTVELSDHVREERLLTADGLDPVPVHVLRPRGQTGGGTRKRAGILAIHGHGMDNDSIAGRDDSAEAKAAIERYRCDYGLELVRRGYVVAVPCLTPFGRRLAPGTSAARRDACEVTQLRLQLLGRNLIAENLRDCLWTLDFLAGQPDVDVGRLGCVGLSLGGRMTMMTAALDARVKVSVIAGALNCLQERIITRSIGGCQTIPGLLNFGDTPEISGLIAPRTILWTVGDRDQLIDKAWAEQALERMRPIYRALGAEKNLMVQHFAGGHVWNGEVAYPLLERELAG